MSDTLAPAAASRDPAEAGDAPPRLSSRSLFGTGREVIIEHDGADYRLRVTSNGKLILTK
ncbi:hemin uptake protein HemP [Ferrovibrio sp.]|uniref:hemin uptake protein HemP n=1 Tax=Ferrovibrio sp. TaxID=1917215 RepID=UPI00312010A1